MSEILSRIDEHLEFHRAMDKHKSDVAFLEDVKQYVMDVREELQYFITQYGCSCGHPLCAKCQDSREALDLITK